MNRPRPDVVTLTLSGEARARLDALATERGTSRSEVVRWLLLGDAESPPDKVAALDERVRRIERRLGI